jgi:hypothetical protein
MTVRDSGAPNAKMTNVEARMTKEGRNPKLEVQNSQGLALPRSGSAQVGLRDVRDQLCSRRGSVFELRASFVIGA